MARVKEQPSSNVFTYEALDDALGPEIVVNLIGEDAGRLLALSESTGWPEHPQELFEMLVRESVDFLIRVSV